MEHISRFVYKIGMMDRFGYTIFHALFDFALLAAIIAAILKYLI